ncbi:MAG: 3-isopropylmalate dehydratase small subunit [Candidatus Pacebacteria bacterium]|nr:3-isopropylmalate dehydratase small subunit [Candidatus Paceibacterota bacterium]
MSLSPIKKVTGRAVPVEGDDIDTDRIIPARYMRCVTFDGLGEFLFHDIRQTPEGKSTKHPIDQAQFNGSTILISGMNFGCGSSREHAPQAIVRAGFKAVIAGNFAEIFFGNSTTLGLPCVTAKKEDLEALTQLIKKEPSTEVQIDLENLKVSAGKLSFPVTMKASAQQGLLSGRYDAIADLLANLPKVKELAAHLP